MAGHTSFGRISDAEFFSLLQELSGTGKGRSFLDEYLRRARPQETARSSTRSRGLRRRLLPFATSSSPSASPTNCGGMR
jgi:hypothetical protein